MAAFTTRPQSSMWFPAVVVYNCVLGLVVVHSSWLDQAGTQARRVECGAAAVGGGGGVGGGVGGGGRGNRGRRTGEGEEC
jgi:hypothetical protein